MNGSEHEYDELDTLFAAAREVNGADLGAADRFLAGWQSAQPASGPAAPVGRTARQTVFLRASAALGLAAALSGLLVLRPAVSGMTSSELPASAAYSVYRSALGDGW